MDDIRHPQNSTIQLLLQHPDPKHRVNLRKTVNQLVFFLVVQVIQVNNRVGDVFSGRVAHTFNVDARICQQGGDLADHVGDVFMDQR